VYGDVQMNPAADEVRREIRALKGLVLNRLVYFCATHWVLPLTAFTAGNHLWGIEGRLSSGRKHSLETWRRLNIECIVRTSLHPVS
jgi:hypothetical protein